MATSKTCFGPTDANNHQQGPEAMGEQHKSKEMSHEQLPVDLRCQAKLMAPLTRSQMMF